MSLFTAFDLSSMGLTIQRKRLDVAAENLANINTTKTPEGGPYQKKSVVVSSSPLKGMEASFDTFLKKTDIEAPRVSAVQSSPDQFLQIYDPHSPDANAQGFVLTPNISSTQEMVDLMSASMAYSANMAVLNESKSLVMKTLDLAGV